MEVIRMKDLISRIDEVYKMRKSEKGKYKVIGVDRFDDSDWVHREYSSAKEAIKEAQKLSKECMNNASDESVATVFYAYAPNGDYIGGGHWSRLDPTDK